MFSDDKGNFNRNEAFTHLNKKFKEGVITEKQLYDIADAIDQRTQSGIYTKKLTAQEQLDMMKTQAEIKKINSDTSLNLNQKDININKDHIKTSLSPSPSSRSIDGILKLTTDKR